MSAADLVLSRLDDPRPTGAERWRAACPVCGGRNRSTLSVGVGDNGCVLFTCFKSGCGPDEIAGALGLQLDDLFPAREHSARPLSRRRMLSPRQALDLLVNEKNLVFVAAANLANGYALTDDDRERLNTATARIGELAEETKA